MKLIHALTTLSTLTVLNLTALAGPECKECDKAECKTATCDKSGDCKSCDSATAGNSVNLVVTGMTCTGCSGKVSKALAAIDGVTTKKVCHKSGSVEFAFDPAKTDKATVVAAVKATGFKVAGEKLSIPVSGMTCASCSTKVMTALNAIEGCSDAKVCHESGSASVTIDTAKTSSAKIVEAINNTGFKAK